MRRTSLEDLLRVRLIHRVRKDRKLVVNSLRQARRDIRTARALVEMESFDWALAVSYNAMLLAGRAVMFSQGYRPSSRAGHVAVVRFLDAFLGVESGERMVMVLDRTRKKRQG